MKTSFKTMISKFQRLPHVGLKVTMKNGSVIDIADFHIRNDTVFDRNGKHASISEIDYIEVNSD